MWKVVLMLFSLIVVVYPCNPCWEQNPPDYCHNEFKIHGNKGIRYDLEENPCNVDEGIRVKLELALFESCNCTDELNLVNMTNSDCQLQLIDQKISCKYNATSSCLLAVENGAKEYLAAVEFELECRRDPTYLALQELWKSCSSGA